MTLDDVACWSISGAGVAFVGGASNASLTFVKFENSQNLGLGAGVLAVTDRSRMALSHSHFIGSFIENRMGLVAPDVPRASCITAESASVVSATYSVFESNTGGDVIFARTNAEVDLAHCTFQSNGIAPTAGENHRRQLGSSAQTNGVVIALVEGAVARVSDSTFSANHGLTAGAITAAGTDTTMSLDRVDFQFNTASAAAGAAGALHVSGGATVRGTHTVFVRNSAASQLAGGALCVTSGAHVVLTDSTLTLNTASPHPDDGALYGGGAVYAQQSHVHLVRTAVQKNLATGGDEITASNFADALYVLAPLAIFVVDSSFVPLIWGGVTVSINPRNVNPGEITQGSCQQHPCALGSSCSYAKFSISCEHCPDGTHSTDGISCELCPPGYGKIKRPLASIVLVHPLIKPPLPHFTTGPTADQTACSLCDVTSLSYSTFGACLECGAQNIVSSDRTSCRPCPLGLGPANAERTQ